MAGIAQVIFASALATLSFPPGAPAEFPFPLALGVVAGPVQFGGMTAEAVAAVSVATAAAASASASATAAAASVTAASGYATAASASKAAADADAAAAASAKIDAAASATLAAAARDTAYANANAYSTTAAGLAATAVGAQFQVADALEIRRYRVDAGPVATLLFTAPTALGVQARAPQWNPAKLALKGGLYWFDVQSLSDMWQDQARTTPAAVGQPVGSIRCRVTGTFAEQATAARRPILRQAVNGQYWLDCYNGGDGQLRWIDVATGGQSAQFSAFALARHITGASASQRVLVSGRSASNTGWELLVNNGGSRATIYNGTAGTTNAFAFPWTQPLLASDLHPLWCGGIYDGTNAIATQDEFVNPGTAATLAGNATAGWRIGFSKYTTTGSQSPVWIGDVILTDYALSVDDARKLSEWARSNRSTARRDVGSLSTLRRLIEAEASNVSVLVISDSTGDAVNEWVFQATQALTARYPRMGVSYRLFDYTSNAWGSTTVLQASSNGYTLTIHNTAKSLSMPRKMMGDRFGTAVSGLASVDIVIWNHGHNIGATYDGSIIRGEYVAAFEQVRRAWPAACHVACLQNPQLYNNDQATREAALRSINALLKEVQIVDIGARFTTLGKPAGLYADPDTNGIHPNTDGATLQTEAFMAALARSGLVAGAAGTGFTATVGTNLLLNGDFSAFTGAAPDNWTAAGSAVITKDTTRVDPSFNTPAWSAKVETGNGYLSQSLSAGNLTTLKSAGAGSLWARQWTIEGQTGSGEVQVIVTSTAAGAVTYKTIGGENQGGAFCDACLMGFTVPSDTTSVEVRLYSASSAGTREANYSRAVLVAGSVPRKM